MREDNLALIAKARSGDADAADLLVSGNLGLIWSAVRRFFGRGYDPDDLFQIGCIGFLKAVEGFDTSYGTQFSTYAVPKITGEILRFMRDDQMVKVGRGLKEKSMKIRQKRAELEQSLGRDPTVSELAQACGMEPEELAAEAATGSAESLQQPLTDSGFSLEQLVHDDAEERMLEHTALRLAIRALPKQEQQVIALRYYRGLTQQKAAEVLHVSQVQISRIERRAIAALRSAMRDSDDTS